MVIKKKKETAVRESFDSVDSLCAGLEKKHGKGFVVPQDTDHNVKWNSTGLLSLDYALGKGMPRGKIIECFGPESCLDKDVKVKCFIKDPNGVGNAHKTWSMERLYERFHKIPSVEQGKYLRPKTNDYEFYIPSVNEQNCIFRNKIADVVKCGIKMCYELITEKGYSIIATKDHKFFNGKKYIPLSKIKIGSEVYIHDNFLNTTPQHKVFRNKETTVKFHPMIKVKVKIVDGKPYEVVPIYVSRLIYEANLNGVSLEEFKNLLKNKSKSWIKKNLKFTPRGYHIHHKDLDHYNNDKDNLVAMSGSEHNKLHALNQHNCLRFIALPDKVKVITCCGVRETYDIKCFTPYNNFVANKFVVHNSGKSSLVYHNIGKAQKRGEKCALIDAEYSFESTFGKALGIDEKELLIIQPDNGEQALDALITMVESKLFGCIGVDSVAALVPEEEAAEGVGKQQMGLQARMMSKGLRKLSAIMGKTETNVFFINQLRMKIGVMFGNPETTTGGNALKFYSHIRLDVRKREWLGDKDHPLGILQHIKVVKNKCSPPFRETECKVWFKNGYDVIFDLFNAAVEFGILERTGNTYTFEGKKVGVGDDGAMAGMKGDKELLKGIYSKTKNFFQEG